MNAPIRTTPASRVLVVEDEPRLRDMLERSAREMGFDAASVRSAEAALKIILDGQADIVLLDLNLPGMNGLEMLERVHRQAQGVQVIILTGYGSLESARIAIRHDAVDFLTKPCPLGDLEMALSRARRRRLRALGSEDPTAANPTDQIPTDGPKTLEELERVHILAALDRNNGNRAATAAELGISERTLYYRLGQYQREQESA